MPPNKLSPVKRPAAAMFSFRKLIVIGFILAGVAWVIVSTFSGRGGISEDVDLPPFADAGGVVHVTLRSLSPEGREWNFEIYGGRLTRSDVPANPEKSATYQIYGGAEGYTPPEGRIFEGPFLVSPNGDYLAASVMLPDTVAFGENKRYAFAVMELETSSFSVLDELSESSVMGLAWSPDSRRVAILKQAVKIGYGPLDILARMAGHSIFYSTWIVEIVDPKNGVIGTVEVAWDLRASGGWISWAR